MVMKDVFIGVLIMVEDVFFSIIVDLYVCENMEKVEHKVVRSVFC